MKIILLLFICFVFGNVVHAQYRVTGEVYSVGRVPLSGVNVMLLRADSTVIGGCVSDTLGCFAFNIAKKGDCWLSFSCLGYQTRMFAFSLGGKNFSVGRVVLDTLEHLLEEVEVLSKSIVRDIDRKVYYPTREQLKHSTNGLTLLYQLRIPFIMVNLAHDDVESAKGSVTIAINGKPVDVSEILALRPEEIVRVESIDYPGVHYGNAAMAINYVTKVKESGGLIGVELHDYMNGRFGKNSFFMKKNHRKSEFGLQYNGSFLDDKYIEQKWNAYRFPDKTIERTSKSEKYPIRFNNNKIGLNYNNRERGKYYFNSTWSGSIENTPGRTHVYRNEVKGEDIPLIVKDSSGKNLKNSSLDLYFERQFKNDKTLVLNVVGSYYDLDNGQTMRYEQNGDLLNVLNYFNRVKKYSFIGEGYFEKRSERSLWTLILKHQYHDSRNYNLFTNQEIQLNQDITEGGVNTVTGINSWKIYVLGQFQRVQTKEYEVSSVKWNYILGVGLEHEFSDRSSLVYSFESESSAPKIGQLDESEYFIDDWSVARGNFYLKPVRQMKNSFMWDFKNEYLHSAFSADYLYCRHPINGSVYREANRFVRKWENQEYRQYLKLRYWVEWNIIPEYLSTNYMVEYHDVVSRGESYRHKGRYWDFLFNMIGMYKNWMLIFEMRELGNELEGEFRRFAKKEDYLFLTYRYGNLSVGAVLFCFLNRDYRNNRLKGYNEWLPYYQWELESRNQLVLKLSYYFSWGKQKEEYNQRIKNVDSDRGINILK